MSKQNGGFGIGSLLDKNKAMLFKWIWKLNDSSDSTWKNIFKDKYYANLSNDLFPKFNDGPKSYLCKGFLAQLYSFLAELTPLAYGLSCRLGDGSKVRFWLDKWHLNVTLKDKFPKLFSISEGKDNFVINMGYWDGSIWIWQLPWRRDRFVWEQQLEFNLLSSLDSVCLLYDKEDTLLWDPGKNGDFNEYTCVISGASNPKKTHIFCDDILECHSNSLTNNFDKKKKKEFEALLAVMSSAGDLDRPEEVSRICYFCRKNFRKDNDIYIYSSECRSIVISVDDALEKSSKASTKPSQSNRRPC
ncbi:hypothetical protein ACFE04_004594 [Oxalis oulophora]